MTFPSVPPVNGNSMNRVTYFKPTSELGSGFINYTTGPHTLVGSIVPAVSGGIPQNSAGVSRFASGTPYILL